MHLESIHYSRDGRAPAAAAIAGEDIELIGELIHLASPFETLRLEAIHQPRAQ
jgi:hypothetical protein